MAVKTRFAPSPTGYLHVGGARTALFSWLHAKQNQGTFVLRIEDTDLERSTQESVDAIFAGMKWMGLAHDEGPYYQTKRFDRYKEIIDMLIEQGHAYRCNCSKERIDALREQQMENKEKPRYDGKCRDANISADDPHVIRFKTPNEGTISFDDLVRGTVIFPNNELDDLIIQRSDGSPTYNLTVVVDDLDMEISHVIRGDDHINNTPRQLHIIQALGKTAPLYGHVPMILGDDGARLSKRHGAVSVMQYHEEGYLPEALLNYLVRLGWSHGDQELFTLDEMLELFDIKNVNKSPSAFNTDKLRWINQHYIKEADNQRLADLVAQRFVDAGIEYQSGADLPTVINEVKERAQTIVELYDNCQYFYRDWEELEAKAAKKHLRPVAADALNLVKQKLTDLTEWKAEVIHQAISQTADELEVGMGKVGQPLRVAVTGQGASPSIDITLALIGQAATLRRLDKALEFIAERAKQ